MKNIVKFTVFLTVFVLAAGCKSQPAATDSSQQVRDIFAGVANVFILKGDLSLWGVGYNRSDQLGLGENQAGNSGDVSIVRIDDITGAPFSGVLSVAAGENHTVILKDDGTLWGAGDSTDGELGQSGGRLKIFVPLKAGTTPITGVKAVAAGNNTTFYVDKDGSLWAAGYNYYGELGLGNRNAQFTFTKVNSAGQNVKALAAGMRHTVLLKEDGTLWAAGYNFNGQLALGDSEDRNSFTEVKDAGSGITAVAAGNYHTVILKSDGSVWTAGSNYYGQLGFAGKADRQTFTRVTDEKGNTLSGVKEIAARGNITVLLKADGSMLLTGNFTDPDGMNEPAAAAAAPDSGASGGINPNDTKSSFTPLVTEDGSKFGDVKKIVLGYNSIYVIASDGRLWAAGSNRYGQLSLGLDTEASSALKLINP
ncbi:MAG: hypothetical protein FWC45_07100 [Treponema sp.]|nr:hypothetical protein [Treponema sp.]